MERVGLEACSPSAWLHDGLTEAGLPAICIEARQAKSVMSAMPNRTDRNDARGLAQTMRTGWYRAVHVKTPACLMSVPGVGPLTALAFRATLDRPDRFRRSRDVGAHLGMTPPRYQSGETDVQGRVSRCRDERGRTALYEAAHSLPIRGTRWSALPAWGMAVAKRRGMNRARVAVLRKLAVILHRLWADGSEFRWGRQPATAIAAVAA